MKENYFAPNMKKNRNNTQGKYIACTRKKLLDLTHNEVNVHVKGTL